MSYTCDVCKSEVMYEGQHVACYPPEADKRIRELREQVEKLSTWRPIDTAPRDGSEVLLRVKVRAGISGKCLVGHYMKGGHCIEGHPPISAGWYFWNGSFFDSAAGPTHWLPLPP